MEPLDLSRRPPRSPREKLAGLYMLARTIDKMRATLPGGNLGEYQIPGFSTRLLETLGIPEEQFREAVAAARGDEDVVAWLRERADFSKAESINGALSSITLADRVGRPDFLARYPLAKRLPPETTLLEMLEHDDAASA